MSVFATLLARRDLPLSSPWCRGFKSRSDHLLTLICLEGGAASPHSQSPRVRRSSTAGSLAAAENTSSADTTARWFSGVILERISEIARRRRSVTSSTRARPASVALISTSRRLSGLGERSTHPPTTIRSIDRLKVDELAPNRSARLPIRSGPVLVRTTSTRKCGRVTNSSAGETDRATTPSSAREEVRTASVVCCRSRGCSFTSLLSCATRYSLECT